LALKRFDNSEASPFERLSERELQIALMVVNCQKVQDISDGLHLSPKTVNSYRYRLFEKLGISSDVELNAFGDQISHGRSRSRSDRLDSMVAVLSQPFDHQAFLQSVTGKPGVYQMLGCRGAVLYVGKAKNLKKRLTSYFRGALSLKTAKVSNAIREIQVTVTNTEAEALLLEHNLIKQHLPPYNILPARR